MSFQDYGISFIPRTNNYIHLLGLLIITHLLVVSLVQSDDEMLAPDSKDQIISDGYEDSASNGSTLMEVHQWMQTWTSIGNGSVRELWHQKACRDLPVVKLMQV